MAMITDVEDFFSRGCGRCARFDTPDCATRQWSEGLRTLRDICRGVGLVETVKWAHPCYVHRNRNIALIGALRSEFRLSLMNAALLKNAQGLLEMQGPNTRHPNVIRFTDNARVDEMKPVITGFLRELMAFADAGVKPPKEAHELELPEELVEALEADVELAEAFHALTPGRQRSYVINLNGAKNAATRIARIAKFRAGILAGRGANER